MCRPQTGKVEILVYMDPFDQMKFTSEDDRAKLSL